MPGKPNNPFIAMHQNAMNQNRPHGVGGNNPVMPKPTTTYKPVPMAKGGKVGDASKRGDGIAQRGKTKCRMC